MYWLLQHVLNVSFCFFLMLRSCLLPYKANKDILCYTEIAISSKPEKVSVITVSLGNVRKLLISLNVQASNFTELLNIIESLDVVAVEWALLNNMHQAMDPLSPVHTGDYSRRVASVDMALDTSLFQRSMTKRSWMLVVLRYSVRQATTSGTVFCQQLIKTARVPQLRYRLSSLLANSILSGALPYWRLYAKCPHLMASLAFLQAVWPS